MSPIQYSMHRRFYAAFQRGNSRRKLSSVADNDSDVASLRLSGSLELSGPVAEETRKLRFGEVSWPMFGNKFIAEAVGTMGKRRLWPEEVTVVLGRIIG